MTASEKLRALDEAFDTQRFLGTLNYYIGPGARTLSSREQQQMYFDVKAILAALPLIADAVEVLEAARPNHPILGALRKALDGSS